MVKGELIKQKNMKFYSSPFVLFISCLVAPSTASEANSTSLFQSLITASPSVSPSPIPVKSVTSVQKKYPVPTLSPMSVKTYSVASLEPTSSGKTVVSTSDGPSANTTATETSSMSSVGSAVCAAQEVRQTDELAFTVSYDVSKDITTKSAVKNITEAMKKSIMDLLQNETVDTTGVEHSLGFWVEDVTFNSTPILSYYPMFSVGFTTLLFNMTFSFECCADYVSLENKVFQLMVSFLVNKQDNLSVIFAKYLNDTAFAKIQWNSELASTTVASSPTQSPTKSPTAMATLAQTSSFTASPSARTPKTVAVPSKMVVITASTFNFTSVTITQWETTTSAYYSSYYQQTSGFQGATVSAKYSHFERVEYTQEIVIYFSLVVTYTYSSISVVQVAQQVLNTTTSKETYSKTLVADLGVDLTVDTVEYKNPPTSPPTKKPTKKPSVSPTTTAPIKSTEAPTKVPITGPTISLFSANTNSPSSSAPKTTTFSSQMVISASSSFTFTSTIIQQWESTTSAYYTNYYQQTSGLRECSVTAKYESIEHVESRQEYVIYYYLVVQYQYTSVSQVVHVAENVLSTSTSKEAYSSELVSIIGSTVQVETVTYSTPQPTKKPSKKPSKIYVEHSSGSGGLETLSGYMTIQCASGTPLNAANFVVWQSVTASYIMSYWSFDTSQVSGLNVTVIPETIESIDELRLVYKINFSLKITYTSISVSLESIAEYPFAPSDAFKYIMQLSNRDFDIDLVDVEYFSNSSNSTGITDASPSTSVPSDSTSSVTAMGATSSAVGTVPLLRYSMGCVCVMIVLLSM